MMNLFRVVDIAGISNVVDCIATINCSNMLYSIGNEIISYNLINENKTIIKYHTSSIKLIKYVNQGNFFVTIDNSISNPVLNLWNSNDFSLINSMKVRIKSGFKVSNVFFEETFYGLFIFGVSSPDCNLIYLIDMTNNTITLIKSILTSNQIKNFAFVKNTLAIQFGDDVLQFYGLGKNLDEFKMLCNIPFQFKLKEKSMRVNRINNIIAILTERGNCLMYTPNGECIQSITPLAGEKFTCISFSKTPNNISLGAQSGKIFTYSISGKLVYFINNKTILQFKETKEYKISNKIKLPKGEDEIDLNKTLPEILYLKTDEEEDLIFAVCNDGTLLFSTLSNLIDKTRNQYNFTSVGKISLFYNISHSKKITSIEVKKNLQKYEPVLFYTSSQDKKILVNRIISNKSAKKISSNYFTLETYFPEIYYTVIKILSDDKIVCGDNRGNIVLINLNESSKLIKFDKYKISNNMITSIEVTEDKKFLSVGFENGLIVLCDINHQMEFCIRLAEKFLPLSEVEYRNNMNQKTSFSYFFRNCKKKNAYQIAVFYSQNKVKISTLHLDPTTNIIQEQPERFLQIQNKILDISIHRSENYLLALTDAKQILISLISNCEIKGIIDLNKASNVYNFSIDISGLYLGVVCNMNYGPATTAKSDLVVFEVGTGKVKEFYGGLFEISCISFEPTGEFLIVCGENGNICLMKNMIEIQRSISAILKEIEIDPNFWDKYEIIYNGEEEYDQYYYNNPQNKRRPMTNQYVQAESDLPARYLDNDIEKEAEEIKEMIKDQPQRKIKEEYDFIISNNSKRTNYDNPKKEKIKIPPKRKPLSKPKVETAKADPLFKSNAQREAEQLNFRQTSQTYNSDPEVVNYVVTTKTNQKISPFVNKPKFESNYKKNIPKSNITFNKDPSIVPYNSKMISKTQPMKIQQESKPFPDLSRKIVTDSSYKRQNDIRIKNIANAINEMVLSEEPKISQEIFSPVTSNQMKAKEESNERIIHSVLSDDKESTEYFINNNRLSAPVNNKYPEPEDIDDLISNSSRHNTNFTSNPKISLGVQNLPKTDSNFSLFSRPTSNKAQTTDDIDYMTDNIRKFEINNNIN